LVAKKTCFDLLILAVMTKDGGICLSRTCSAVVLKSLFCDLLRKMVFIKKSTTGYQPTPPRTGYRMQEGRDEWHVKPQGSQDLQSIAKSSPFMSNSTIRTF
jgi:hypothetical protein